MCAVYISVYTEIETTGTLLKLLAAQNFNYIEKYYSMLRG